MKKNYFFLLFSVMSLFIISCSKEGPTGATGPQGTQGPSGTTGSTGAAGTPANVIYSAWVTSPYDQRDTTIDGTCIKVRHLDAPSLTSAIVDQGAILTYFRIGSIGPYQLPYISDAGGATNEVNCIYNVQKILIYRHTFNTCRFTSANPATFAGQPVMIALPQALEFRYVIVPGLVSGGRSANGATAERIVASGPAAGYSESQLKAMPYDQVCKLFRIPE